MVLELLEDGQWEAVSCSSSPETVPELEGPAAKCHLRGLCEDCAQGEERMPAESDAISHPPWGQPSPDTHPATLTQAQVTLAPASAGNN